MARVKIELTCTTCGKTFEHIKRDLRNSAAAESYEEWARENVTECPDCYRVRMAAEAAEKLDATLAEYGYTLPTIEGVSEKQTAYAETVRRKHLQSNLYTVRRYHKANSTLTPANLAKVTEAAAAIGKTADEWIVERYKKAGLYEIHVAITEARARVILDTLK